MVRRGDHDCIDVFAIEDLAIIAVGVRLLALTLFYFRYVFRQYVRIDIGQSREIGEVKRFACNSPTLIAQSDRREDRAVIRRLIANCLVGRGEQDACSSCGRDALKKLATQCLLRGWHL